MLPTELWIILEGNTLYKNGKAGCDWYHGFCCWHLKLTLRKPEALSYMRAKCDNSKVVEDFFAR